MEPMGHFFRRSRNVTLQSFGYDKYAFPSAWRLHDLAKATAKHPTQNAFLFHHDDFYAAGSGLQHHCASQADPVQNAQPKFTTFELETVLCHLAERA